MPNGEIRPKFYVKSFFADSVQDAMEQAQLEMGPDALLLNSREAPPEARHLGSYEVVFGEYADVVEDGPAFAQETELRRLVAPSERTERFQHSIDNLRTTMGRKTEAEPSEPAKPAPIERIIGELLSAGVDARFADEIKAALRIRLKKRAVADISRPHGSLELDDAAVVAEAREEIAARCRVESEIGRVTVLVGPPGSGKTTTLVKLAVTQGLQKNKPVRLISTDAHRIGGAAQLETFAAILGVPFQIVASPAALEQVIDSAPANTLLLVDTPGYSAALFRELGTEFAADLAGLLACRQEIDTHLVLTASMCTDAMRDAADLYSVFRPSKLLFTHLDEATPYGTVLCEAARRKLKLSFFANGQSIPEDLEPADAHRVADLLVQELPKTSRAVA
jgi:flagellar biosynthesis protein FlhF